MTAPINLTQLRHDAEIEAGLEDGDCILSDFAYTNAVLALIDTAEAAQEFLNEVGQWLPGENKTGPITRRLRQTLNRYTTE